MRGFLLYVVYAYNSVGKIPYKTGLACVTCPVHVTYGDLESVAYWGTSVESTVQRD